MSAFSTRMSPRDRTVLVFGVVVIGSLVGASKGLPRWREWEQTQQASATEALREASTLEATSRGLRALRDSAGARKARVDSLMAGLVAAATPQSAVAMLASTISGFANDAEVRLVSATVRSDSVFTGGFATVAVRVSAIGDIEGFIALFHHIEGSDLLLAIRELNVSQPEPAAPDNRPETLHADFVIESLAVRRTDARQPPSSKGSE
jgi:hypothetical protein